MSLLYAILPLSVIFALVICSGFFTFKEKARQKADDLDAWRVYVENTCNRIRSLKGAVISNVTVIEGCLLGGEDVPATFRHPDAPFIQVFYFEVELEDGRVVDLACDDFAGIRIDFRDKPILSSRVESITTVDDEYSIHRLAPEVDFLIGAITDVSFFLDKISEETEEVDVVSKIFLTISGKTVLLKAGEVFGDDGNRFDVVGGGDAILLFQNASDIEHVKFGREWILDE